MHLLTQDSDMSFILMFPCGIDNFKK